MEIRPASRAGDPVRWCGHDAAEAVGRNGAEEVGGGGKTAGSQHRHAGPESAPQHLTAAETLVCRRLALVWRILRGHAIVSVQWYRSPPESEERIVELPGASRRCPSLGHWHKDGLCAGRWRHQSAGRRDESGRREGRWGKRGEWRRRRR